MSLIRTKYKNKLSKDMSYPVGAEIISEALVDVPQYSLFDIRFHDRDEWQMSKYRQRIQEKGIIKAFEIGYSRMQQYHSSPKSFIENGEYEPKWEIGIYAVPKENKKIVKNLIVGKLKTISKWLEDIGVIERYGVDKYILNFNISSQTLEIKRMRS